jgi:hypothetical protein
VGAERTALARSDADAMIDRGALRCDFKALALGYHLTVDGQHFYARNVTEALERVEIARFLKPDAIATLARVRHSPRKGLRPSRQ